MDTVLAGVPVPSLNLLEFWCQHHQIPFAAGIAADALREAAADPRSPSGAATEDSLVHAGRQVGLRVTPVEASCVAALSLVHPDAPLAVHSAKHDDWLVVTDVRGRKFLVGRPLSSKPPEWMTPAEVAELLGEVGPEQPVTWWLAAASSPVGELRQAPADHLIGAGEAGGNHPTTRVHGSAEAHDHGHEHPHRPPFMRLLGLLRPERRDIWVVITFAAWVGVLSLASPIAVESLVNTVALAAVRQPVIVLSALLFFCLSFAAVLRALQAYTAEIIQRRIFVRVVADLAYRLPRVSLSAFDRHHGPELVNRFFDTMTVQKVSATLLLEGVSIVLQTTIGLVILGFYHPYLLGYDIALVTLMGFAIFGLGRGGVRTSIRESYAKYAVADWLEELARRPMAFKHGGGAEYALTRADTLARDYLAARDLHYRVVFRQMVAALALQAIASTILLGLGGWLVISGELTLGQLVAAELIVAVVVGSFAKLGKQLESFYDLMAAVDKVGHLVDLPTERLNGQVTGNATQPATVRVQQLGFAYDAERPVLEDVSLTLRRGERVALVGPSGSGKTTLVELLYGLREPLHGHIELNGADLRELRLDHLRTRVAVVNGNEIVARSIAENVSFGRPEVSGADVRNALTAVGVLEELLQLPDGLQTQLTSDGSPLSLGQIRRVVLARAIAARPSLLIIDEAIDGLDRESREVVARLLFETPVSWTLLIVSHTPDVIERCDRIILLREGRIVETTEQPPAANADIRRLPNIG